MEPTAPFKPVEAPLRIFCKNGRHLSVSVKGDKVVLVNSNPYDQNQQWYKVDISSHINDNDGYPCFALINRATSQAIKHPAPNRPVELVKNYSETDKSIIWSERILDDGYKSVRVITNTNLTWDVNGGNIKEGSQVGIDNWNGAIIQRWIITPWAPLPSLGTPIRLSCKAGPTFSVTIKDGKLALAPNDPYNKHQQWYKHETSTHANNNEGYSRFLLINEATGQTFKYSDSSLSVELIDFVSDNNKSIILTERNLVDGSKFINSIIQTNRTLDAIGGTAANGIEVGSHAWHGKDNQRWFISRCVPLPHRGMGHPVRVRIYCKDYSHFALAVKGDKVVVSTFDPSDELQAWYKYDVHVTPVNNAEDLVPRFVVVNKATGLAIKHATGNGKPVQLVAYDPKVVNNSTLWTALDFGDSNNYRAIKMFNVGGNLTWDAQSIPVKLGVTLGCSAWHGQSNQRWMMEPF